jgi:hypothetical protein
MKLNEIKTRLNEEQIFTHESWPSNQYIKKINDNYYGIYNKENNLIEKISELNLLPCEGWNLIIDEFENLKNMKIGRICQSYN